MSTEENKTLVKRFLAVVINRGDMDAAAAYCAPSLAWHGGSVGEFDSLDAFKQGVAGFFTAFPDLRVDDPALVAEGDKVVAHYSWRGTQKGEFFGVPATGKTVNVSGMSIYRIADGKIAEEWWIEDVLGLMQQLGASPA
jgi:steroid delta-isomerase-like uncharacterized protein